jgi:hypothetical protein
VDFYFENIAIAGSKLYCFALQVAGFQKIKFVGANNLFAPTNVASSKT